MTVEARVNAAFGAYVEDGKTSNATIIADLGLDSLDIIEITMHLEDEFDVQMRDDVVENFKTVGDFVDHVVSLKKEQ